MTLDAMIFAAGLGTRLRPLTDSCPKALIEVGGMTMLERAARRAGESGAERIAVNIHHHAEIMRIWIGEHCPDLLVCDESDRLLDTGGGLAAALPMLTAEDTLVMNADILTNLLLEPMIKSHKRSGADITLLTANRETSRYLLFDEYGHMRGWKNYASGEIRPHDLPDADKLYRLAFGGIHIMSRRAKNVLSAYATGKDIFPIMDFYIDICGTLDIRSYVASDPYTWIDIGRYETLELARNIYSRNGVE